MDHVRYCAHCGTPAKDGRFCAKCGNALVPSTPNPVHGHAEALLSPNHPQQPPQPEPHAAQTGGLHLGHPSWSKLWHRPGRVGITVAVGLIAIIGTGGFLVQHAPTRSVIGALSLEDSDTISGLSTNDACSGGGGYDDIKDGAQGVLEDGDGSTLATSTLSPGTFDGLACVFHFTFEGVPKAGFYVLRIGHTTRGDLRYSHQAMVDQDWFLDLSLGE